MNPANKPLIFLVVLVSFYIQNSLTRAFGGLRSIQLSYECGRAGASPRGGG
jgi:hypothetical protein